MQFNVIQKQVMYSTEIALNLLLIFVLQYFYSLLHNFFSHNLVYYTICFRVVYTSS
jgi:hypothetical protein